MEQRRKENSFPASDFGGRTDLYIFETGTKILTRLTNDYYDDRDPDFSPEGNLIVFSSDRTTFGPKGSYNLFMYDLSNGNINYLTIGNQIDYSPHFSADGSKIVYTSTTDGSQNIWMLTTEKLLSG